MTENDALYDNHLLKELRRLEQVDVTLKIEKCQFLKDYVKFLGQISGFEGVRADSDKLKAVTDMKEPKDVNGVTQAVTWGYERFSDFLIGIHLHIETNHKPLVSLFGLKDLDELPPHIWRLRLWLM